MKNWKKLVAMVLAGVMALAMLTACGGAGVEMYRDQEAEKAVQRAMEEKEGDSFEASGKLNNIAWNALANFKKNDGSITWMGNHGVTDVDGNKVYVNVATIGSVNRGDDDVSVDNVTTIDAEKLLKWMEDHKLFRTIDIAVDSDWIDIGFAVGKKDGKIYIAFAIECKSSIGLL